MIKIHSVLKKLMVISFFKVPCCPQCWRSCYVFGQLQQNEVLQPTCTKTVKIFHYLSLSWSVFLFSLYLAGSRTVFPNHYSSSCDQKLLVPTYRLFQSVLITSALPVLFFFIHEILRVLLKTKSLLPAVLLASSLKESMPWYHTAEPATHDEVSWFLLPNSVNCLTTRYWYCNNCSCHLRVTKRKINWKQ